MTQADAELARQWAEGGDREALRALYERHSRRVYAFARAMSGSEDAAAEVLQETFLRAAKAMGRFRGQAQFLTWLLAVARSAAAIRIQSGQVQQDKLRMSTGSGGGFRLKLDSSPLGAK